MYGLNYFYFKTSLSNSMNELYNQLEDSSDGYVKDLGYRLASDNRLTYSDLALFKTRSLSKYTHEMDLVLGADFDNTTIEQCMNMIENHYPNIINVMDRENKLSDNIQITENYARHNLKGRILEIPNSDMLRLEFRGRVIDIYGILQSYYIYHLSYTLTTFYFENISTVITADRKTMSRIEYNENIIRYIAKKEDESIYCCLSLEKIKRGQTVATACCGHKFKSKELRIWLTKECIEPTCPLCRINLLNI